MAKPIFIIEFPHLNGQEAHEQVMQELSKKLFDYHTLVLMNSSLAETKFHCFYSEDFTETNFEELKQIIKDKIDEATLRQLDV